MKKGKIPSGFLLFAGLAMTMWSFAGCAASGHQAGFTEFNNPTAETLEQLPEDTPVEVHLVSGNRVEGTFLSYSPENDSMFFNKSQVDQSLSTEFDAEGTVYRIPMEKIVAVSILESPNQAKTSGFIVAGVVLVFGAFMAYVRALAGATH